MGVYIRVPYYRIHSHVYICIYIYVYIYILHMQIVWCPLEETRLFVAPSDPLQLPFLLGRLLGHLIISLIWFKRTTFKNSFRRV